MVSHLGSDETETQGDVDAFGVTRTKANPQDITTTNVLGKLVFTPAAGHEFRLGLELKDKDTDTDARRVTNFSITSPNNLSRITRNTGSDSVERQRVSLDYIHTPGALWYDLLTAKLYWQEQETRDRNYQLRSNASLNATWGCSASTAGAGNCDVNQLFTFKQSHLGASLVMEKATEGAMPQYLTWGADWVRTRTSETADTTWTNRATGATSNNFLGEVFPKSDFPKGHADQLGIFGQDEIQLAGGRLRITPGLRYDRFRLDPDNDPMYRPVAGATPSSKSGGRLSPKLAASFEFMPRWHVYGQYVEGYRAPNYEQVNRYFLNNQQNYGIVGNANLNPETSKGVEVGVKAGDDKLGGQVAVFRNRYDDFIDNVRLAAGDPANLPAPYTITYQYRNLQNVSINGFELRGHWQALRALKLSAAFAYAWGEYESATAAGTFLPLNSIEPRRLTLSALWTPSEQWGAEARLRAAARQSRVDDSSGALMRPSGYSVVDLGAWWQVRRDTRLNVTVGNLFDRRYILWSDVRTVGVSTTDRGADFYTQSGRSLSASVKMEF